MPEQDRTSIRAVAVALAPHRNSKATNEYALSFAEIFDASIKGFSLLSDPALPLAGPLDAIPPSVIEDLLARSETEARDTAAAFERQAQTFKPNASAEICRIGRIDPAEQFATYARLFDIAIVPQAAADESELPDFVQGTLLGSGHPVLVVPYIHKARASFERILVCWDGSRPAARALSDALPMLRRAKVVDVITAGSDEEVAAIQHGLEGYLAQHGVQARLQSLNANGIDIGNAILSYAADAGTTLLVMGGYGNSRAREWILGGVTRTILATMTVPVLLSH